MLPKPLNPFSILVSFSLSKPLNPKHLPTSRASKKKQWRHRSLFFHLSFNTLFITKALPLSPFLFLSLSLPLPKSLLSLSTRHRTFTVRAESQNGVNPVPTHYDFNLFTIGVGSDEVQAVRLATNYGTSVAICEFPFSTISSETTGGVGKT